MRKRSSACALGAFLLAGCTIPGSATSLPTAGLGVAPRPAESVSHYREPAASENAARAGTEVVQASAPRPAPESTMGAPSIHAAVEPAPAALPLTLANALNQSLVSNPDLVTLRGQVRINQAMVGVAQTYPFNPFVQAQYLPSGQPFVANAPGMPASGTGYASYYIWVMQRFELAHQRRHRTDSAMATMTQVQWNIFQGELLNVAQTTRLYFATLYQQELFELARETAELNERLLVVVEGRFKANLARASDVTTARVAARQSRHQADLAGMAYQAALLTLRQQLNLPAAVPVALAETLADVEWLPLAPSAGEPAESLCAAELIEGRPDVMAAKAGVRVSQANLNLARAARIPDLQAGPIYDTGSDTTRYLGLRLQMDLPIWNNGKPLVRQREAEMGQQQLTAEQLKVRATLEAQNALEQYERLRELARKTPLGRAGATPAELKEMIRLFEAGQADVLVVLTTQNNLLQERRIGLDLLNQLGLSAAAVIQATGLPPSRVIHLAGSPCMMNAQPPPAPVQP